MPEGFSFCDLRELFAKANEQKSGDQLAGLAAGSERERVAAKFKLADLPLAEILHQPLIDPDKDEVSRLLAETFDETAFQPLQSLTVGEFREFILDDRTAEAALKELQWGILPEMAAAVAKIMSNKDLILAGAKIRNVTRCRNTMGQPGVLGIRVQPNHPTDDVGGILLSAFEGAAVRVRRRRDRRKPSLGFAGDGRNYSRCARTPYQDLRDSDPKLLPRAHHSATRRTKTRSAA